MRKSIQFIVKVGLFTTRYFACPLIIVFGIMFFILVIPNITEQYIDYTSFVFVSLIVGLLFSVPIFFVQIGSKITVLLTQRVEKNTNNLDSYLSKLKPSIKTRLALKKYFLLLSISLFLVATVLIGNSTVNRATTSLSFGIGYIFLMTGLFCFLAYQNIYKENERALFFMEKSVERIDNCLKKTESISGTYFFEKALRSYQKTMPSFSAIKSLNDRIKQTELVLKLGTREEINAIRDIMNNFATAIRGNDEPFFYDSLAKLNKILEKFVEEKKEMIKLNMPSNREVVEKSFIEALKPIWDKVVPYLIIIAVLALIYVFFGVNLAKFFGFT
jgi:hypothetical protein